MNQAQLIYILFKELKASFRAFDKDGNGRITHKELKEVIKMIDLDLNDTEIDELITAVDKNNDGTIEFNGRLLDFAKRFLNLT